MSKKIEEVFNMASTETPAHTTAEETGFDLESMQQALDTADKIDQASQS